MVGFLELPGTWKRCEGHVSREVRNASSKEEGKTCFLAFVHRKGVQRRRIGVCSGIIGRRSRALIVHAVRKCHFQEFGRGLAETTVRRVAHALRRGGAYNTFAA